MGRKALYECPDCGNEVSKSASVCPHCGRKLRTGRTILGVIIIIIGIVTLLDALGIRLLPFIYWAKIK